MTESNQPTRDEQLLSAYIDGELTAEELVAVEAWLAEDGDARELVEELRNVAATLQGLPTQTLSDDWKRTLAERLDRATISTSSPANSPEANSHKVIPRLSVGRSLRGWTWSVGAIAAALLIMFLLPEPEENKEIAKAPPHATESEVASATGEAIDGIAAAKIVDEGGLLEPPSAAMAGTSLPLPATVPAMDFAMDSASPATGDANALNARNGLMGIEEEERKEELGYLDDGPYLIVWADMPTESLRRQEFHTVLRSNQIELDRKADSWANVAEPVRRQIASRNIASRNIASRNEVQSDAPKRARLSSQTDADDSPPIEGETLLVEASVEQIVACLVDMNGDTGNFQTITIEPVDERHTQEWGRARRGKLAVKERWNRSDKEKRRRFSELEQAKKNESSGEKFLESGAAPTKASVPKGERSNSERSWGFQGYAQRVERPGDWYYFNSPPKKEGRVSLLKEKSGDFSRKIAKSVQRREELAQQVASLHELYSEAATGKASVRSQGRREAAQPLQVLFVLRNADLQAPASKTSPGQVEAAKP